MSLLHYVKNFPVRSLPVRKELVKIHCCPECGGTVGGENRCLDPVCCYDVTSLTLALVPMPIRK